VRIVLTNFGTTGDVLPLISLGLELRRRGHEPVLGYSTRHRAAIEGSGLTFAPIGPDASDAQDAINLAWTTESDAPYSASKMRELLKDVLSPLSGVYAELLDLAAGADVLCAGPAQPAARMVHETSGIPFASVQFSHFGGIGSPALRDASADAINPLRCRLGLEPLQDPLTIDANSPQLALYAMSRHVIPIPRAWPAHWHMTGFFFNPVAAAPIDPMLSAFVGERPTVVFTFGSMVHRDSHALIRLLAEAARLAAVRAVIQHADPAECGELGPDVRVVGFVDHAALFPRAVCVVHHGGGGTAAAVFRAGVPSVFVPHGSFYDQTYWAALACEAGCAGPPIDLAALTAELLARRLIETLANDRYRDAARRLGAKVGGEAGVSRACELIERLLGTSRPAAVMTAPGRRARPTSSPRGAYGTNRHSRRPHTDPQDNP
jgi:sterol 3beta-glucosyltransferase